MVVTSRAIVAFGFGLIGLGCLASPANAQAVDGAVRKSATQPQQQPQPRATTAAAAAPKPQAAVAPVFGTVDLKAVFDNYDKVKAQKEEFKAAAEAKHKDLMSLQSEGQAEAQKLAKMTPNSVDAKKIEDHLSEIKAKLEAGREQAQRDFALRESEMLATLYKEVQDMVQRIAEYKGMNYIVQVSNEPISGSDPNSVMAAMAKTVVYADPRNDITKDVWHNLNLRYQAVSGITPKTGARTTPSGN